MVHVNILEIAVQREGAIVHNRIFGLEGFDLIEILRVKAQLNLGQLKLVFGRQNEDRFPFQEFIPGIVKLHNQLAVCDALFLEVDFIRKVMP